MARQLLLLLAGTTNALRRPTAPRRTLVTRDKPTSPSSTRSSPAPRARRWRKKVQASEPARFTYHETSWDKFPDGTDRIVVGGFQPRNEIAGEHVLMLASFHDNDVTLSQFQVMVMLLMSFVESLTIVLPFYPTGTMERVVTEARSLLRPPMRTYFPHYRRAAGRLA